MKTSAWLVIHLDAQGNPFIDRAVKQRRPRNEMAIHVTLDIDMAVLQPQLELLVDTIDQVTANVDSMHEAIERLRDEDRELLDRLAKS